MSLTRKIQKNKNKIISGVVGLSMLATPLAGFAADGGDRTAAENFVNRIYTVGLERPADADGLKYWTDRLLGVTDPINAADMVDHIFVGAPEFQNMNKTDAQLIEVFYQTFFNRTADLEGAKFWEKELHESSKRAVVASMLDAGVEFQNFCDAAGIDRGRIELDADDNIPHNPDPWVDELIVDSVSAITKHVSSLAGTNATNPKVQLEFAVNGKTTASTVAELEKDGYTVEFQSTDNVHVDAKGLFDNSTASLAAGATFKYKVIVKKDNAVVAESALVTVTVANASIVVKPTELTLIDDNNDADLTDGDNTVWELPYITMDNNDSVENKLWVIVSKGQNFAGTEIDAQNATSGHIANQENLGSAVVTYTSSNAAVAVISTQGQITAVAPGTTTITVTVGEESKTLDIEVKAAPKATSIDETSMKLQATETSIDVNLNDQYGQEMRKAVDTSSWSVETGSDKTTVVNLAGASLSESASVVTISGLVLAKGTDTLVIKDADDKVIGTINVQVVDVAGAEVDNYKLIAPVGEDFALNLYPSAQIVDLSVESYVGDVKVGTSAIAPGSMSFVSATPAVATVDISTGVVTAVSQGTAVIKLMEGTLVRATATITVTNNTPQITGIALAEGSDAVTVDGGVSADNAVIADIFDDLTISFAATTDALDEDGSDALTAIEFDNIYDADDYISAVTITDGDTAATATSFTVTGADKNGTLVIKVKETYGGGIYTFPLVVKDATGPSNDGIAITFSDTDADDDEIGGDIEFTKATSEADVAKYVVTVSDEDGAVFTEEVAATDTATYTVTIPADTEVKAGTTAVKISIVPVDAQGNAGTAVEKTDATDEVS
ncbi:DUF4214 domain-containing protein [Desulfotomaculum sp. 1211_IL3151]|uniref:DUF4214 domain-containing protein n=1 Tax=Desulfotomaculum sp. 1211_IL3151 TaxID=3084055 RepID=UPI002FDB21B7